MHLADVLTWKYDVKKDLKEIGGEGVDWICLIYINLYIHIRTHVLKKEQRTFQNTVLRRISDLIDMIQN